MGSSAHANALSTKHRTLEVEIEEELAKPAGDDLRVQQLKRQKLKIKDEIVRRGYASG
ncbi:MAG: YdcH family protein [Pseudomonadota bacterium]